ncbi:helix-turn-helix transcriptional regulator, partial [Burkholderia glumae]|uniref:helix-turn-helix transcriptional regulator n=1 Tax=Burkholderia glumae TaxID=337 RepID=UPI0005C29A1E
MPANPQPRTYAMPERSDRLDFYIRDQTSRQPITEPHRHAYFQIQFNLGGDTEQRIGGVTRPFPRGALAFILPFREHLIPHPPGAHFIVINFSQAFLRADLDVDPLDLDEVPVQRAPELAPFRFQERLDYILTGDAFDDARRLAQRMLDADRERGFGSATLLRGYLLQLIGLVSTQYAGALGRLAKSHCAQQAGRRDALARVMRHVRANLTSGELTLAGTAQAAFLSPNYLAHLVRKETGSTFTELVTARRIALAQSLLAHTTRRIADIAHEVGFRDEGYFSRRFRACVGISPKDYREANGAAGVLRGEAASAAGGQP